MYFPTVSPQSRALPLALFSGFVKAPPEGGRCLFKPHTLPVQPISVLTAEEHQERHFLDGYQTVERPKNANAHQALIEVNALLDEVSPNHAVLNSNRRFANARLSHLPNKIRIKISAEYQRRLTLKDGSNRAMRRLRNANIYLRKTTDFINQVWLKYPFHNVGSFLSTTSKHVNASNGRKTTHYGGFALIKYRNSQRLKDVANRLALTVLDEVRDAGSQNLGDIAFLKAYDAAAAICQQWQVTPPYYCAVKNDHIIAAAECAILRMTSPKWWLNQLRTLRDLCCEHLNVAAGLVGEDSPFLSRDSFNEWCEQQKSSRDWLERTMIESEAGVVLPLIDAAMAGNANPANRFTELIVRARGLEEVAEEQGQNGLMITLTAPSQYHFNSDKWNGESARFTQAYLSGQWRKIRAALSYRNIHIQGLRVTEPHKDGTPHWHMLIFIHPEHAEVLNGLLEKYAFEVDGDEEGAAEHRLVIEPVDKAKGSAVGYIIKYLSKNIKGEHMQGELDFESGLSAHDAATNAAAWASRYRLRQFQFFGSSSVQVWRELRRLKACPQPAEIEPARAAADSSNWKAFEAALAVNPIKLDYEETQCGNEFGEMTKRVFGLRALATKADGKIGVRSVITRGEKWTIRPMSDEEKLDYKQLKVVRAFIFKKNASIEKKQDRTPIPKWRQAHSFGLGSGLGSGAKSRGSGDTWTCGNNCTDAVWGSQQATFSEEVLRYLASHGVTEHYTLEQLAMGLRIFTDTGRMWWVSDGQLQFERLLDKEESEFDYF
ncbi:replication endonuclease [Shewanella psychropiezotolerans]|uniref:Replication endonuclease n=1 Tax=Shewanella psychropiezotolerans TaxID=2593655 RepID=A0ABX5WTR7_9GAMM|nr:replication endonuclease [Shewanella psychropiezotolerans]QDO82399.1 replication endonuclease [Shewanella psychropiezotolerans]